MLIHLHVIWLLSYYKSWIVVTKPIWSKKVSNIYYLEIFRKSLLISNAVHWQAWKNSIFVSYNFYWTAQSYCSVFVIFYFYFLPLLFFKGIFHLVHSGLNSVSLGHIVLTMASQSQHVLALLSLSELIFSSRSLCSSCPGRLSVLGMCQAICFLRVFAFAFLCLKHSFPASSQIWIYIIFQILVYISYLSKLIPDNLI